MYICSVPGSVYNPAHVLDLKKTPRVAREKGAAISLKYVRAAKGAHEQVNKLLAYGMRRGGASEAI